MLRPTRHIAYEGVVRFGWLRFGRTFESGGTRRVRGIGRPDRADEVCRAMCLTPKIVNHPAPLLTELFRRLFDKALLFKLSLIDDNACHKTVRPRSVLPFGAASARDQSASARRRGGGRRTRRSEETRSESQSLRHP